MESLIKEITNFWSLGNDLTLVKLPSFANQVRKVTTATGEAYILKPRTSIDQVKLERRLFEDIAKHNLLMPEPLPTTSGQHYAVIEGQVFVLYPFISGECQQDHFAPGAIKRANLYGSAIATLHQALACLPTTGLPRFDFLSEVKSAIKQLQPYLNDNQRVSLDSLMASHNQWRTQLIHRDIHPGNMLFQQGKLVAYLDFDLTCVGPAIFDLAYCATSILISGFSDQDKRYRWLDLQKEMVEGYSKVNPLTLMEVESLWPVMVGIQAIFAAFSYRGGYQAAADLNLQAMLWLASRLQV